MQLTIGEMLYRFRIERDVDAKQVCHGLCSASTLSKMENGQAIPDALMFEYLVERMGVSSSQFSVMLTQEECQYYDWKYQVYDVIEKENWAELGKLLNSKILKKTYFNKKIESQFFFYAGAVYNAKTGDYIKAAELIEKAAEQTMPDPSKIIEGNMLLSSMELSILMLYLYYGIKGGRLSSEQGVHLFQLLEEYIYSDAIDLNEKAICYPKLVCIAVHVLENLPESEQEKYLERAIYICQKATCFYELTEVLRLYIKIKENKNDIKLGFYKKQYGVFVDLLESENISTEFKPEIVKTDGPRYYLVQEYLSSKRKEKGFTQEMLSEGICEPETYSRIENGKRTPSRKNMQLLSERLGITWNYYRGEIHATNPRAFKLRKLQRMANLEGRREDSLKLLAELESLLDMTCLENYIYVREQECFTKHRMGLLDTETTYWKLKELWDMTQGIEEDVVQQKYYSQTELEMIAEIANMLKRQEKAEEGIQIILTVLRQMLNSKLEIEDRWICFEYLFSILSGLYFQIEKYDIAYDIDKYIMNVKIKRREGDTLPLILDKVGDDLEHIGEQYSEEYKKLYRYTYYVSDFFGIGITEAAKQIYEKNFDHNIEWY